MIRLSGNPPCRYGPTSSTCHYFLQWVLFNDRKVGISENPPRGMGYLYIFKQK